MVGQGYALGAATLDIGRDWHGDHFKIMPLGVPRSTHGLSWRGWTISSKSLLLLAVVWGLSRVTVLRSFSPDDLRQVDTSRGLGDVLDGSKIRARGIRWLLGLETSSICISVPSWVQLLLLHRLASMLFLSRIGASPQHKLSACMRFSLAFGYYAAWPRHCVRIFSEAISHILGHWLVNPWWCQLVTDEIIGDDYSWYARLWRRCRCLSIKRPKHIGDLVIRLWFIIQKLNLLFSQTSLKLPRLSLDQLPENPLALHEFRYAYSVFKIALSFLIITSVSPIFATATNDSGL